MGQMQHKSTFFSVALRSSLNSKMTKTFKSELWKQSKFVISYTRIAVSLFMLTSMAMMSRFPPLYLKTLMYGISLGTLMGSMVQIICLAFGGSSTEVALIYFTIGTIICVITLIVSYCIQYNPRFNFYQGDVEADTKKPLPTWRELKEVSVNIWPHLLSTFIGCITSTMSGPSITALITSDNYKAEDPWTAVYFVPVLAFFLPGVCGLLSRIASTPIVNKSNVHLWFAANLVQSIGIAPLLLFCNWKSKKNLPTLFRKDWEFITLQSINSFGASYFHTTCFLSLPEFAGNDAELTFLVMATMMGVFVNVASPLSSLWVNIL